MSCDISKNTTFKSTFNRFYGIRRNGQWRDNFYRVFQTMRSVPRKEVSFDAILSSISGFGTYANHVEASFASKMLATIDDSRVLWDSRAIAALKSLGISVPTVKGTSLQKRMASARKISPAQAKELFERIDQQELFEAVRSDYRSMCLTLCECLKENGVDIWVPSEALSQQTAGMFKNLSNPNFPASQRAKVLVEIISADPYRAEYHQYLREAFDNSPETQSIRAYFGIDA